MDDTDSPPRFLGSHLSFCASYLSMLLLPVAKTCGLSQRTVLGLPEVILPMWKEIEAFGKFTLPTHLVHPEGSLCSVIDRGEYEKPALLPPVRKTLGYSLHWRVSPETLGITPTPRSLLDFAWDHTHTGFPAPFSSDFITLLCASSAHLSLIIICIQGLLLRNLTSDRCSQKSNHEDLYKPCAGV